MNFLEGTRWYPKLENSSLPQPIKAFSCSCSPLWYLEIVLRTSCLIAPRRFEKLLVGISWLDWSNSSTFYSERATRTMNERWSHYWGGVSLFQNSQDEHLPLQFMLLESRFLYWYRGTETNEISQQNTARYIEFCSFTLRINNPIPHSW